jgi:hypothetical protein
MTSIARARGSPFTAAFSNQKRCLVAVLFAGIPKQTAKVYLVLRIGMFECGGLPSPKQSLGFIFLNIPALKLDPSKYRCGLWPSKLRGFAEKKYLVGVFLHASPCKEEPSDAERRIAIPDLRRAPAFHSR